MYMANAKILRLLPNATYIPLTCVGGFVLGVGDVKNLHLKNTPNCFNSNCTLIEGVLQKSYPLGGTVPF